MNKLLPSLLLLLPLAAGAGEWSVQIHGFSRHFQQRSQVPWTDVNDGFGIRYAVNNDLAFQVGHFRNPQTVQGFNFFTNYGLVDYTPLHVDRFSFGVFAGVISGEDNYTYEIRNGAPHVTSLTEVGTQFFGGIVGRAAIGIFNINLRVRPDQVGVDSGIRF